MICRCRNLSRAAATILLACAVLAITTWASGDSLALFSGDEFGVALQDTETSAANPEPILAFDPFLAEHPPAPRWSARLGVVFLQRACPASEYLVYNPVTGASILDPGDLVFPFQGGVDAGLLWHGRIADLEFRYFGIEDATASLGPVVSPDGVALNVPDDDPSFDPTAVEMSGASSLQSFELNLRRNVTPRWTLLAGLRYVAFRDAMGLIGGDPTLTDYGSITFGTINNLYGLQIGADGILWTNGQRLSLESAIKAGVFANGISTSLDFTSTDPNEETASIRYGRDRTSFVGDLTVTGVYQLNRAWSLRAGYQLLWLSGVAVGSMQFHNFGAGLIPNNSGTVLFHGALLGVERRW